MSEPRTQQQILDRYREAADADFFGFRREVLALPMTIDTLRVAAPKAEIKAWTPLTYDEVEQEARGYLGFAVDKILDHRGLSASRSVEKLTEYAWLLGRDDVVAAMDAAGYEQYGAPTVRAFAEGMGWPFFEAAHPADRAELERMSTGQPCTDHCESGCGQ